MGQIGRTANKAETRMNSGWQRDLGDSLMVYEEALFSVSKPPPSATRPPLRVCLQQFSTCRERIRCTIAAPEQIRCAVMRMVKGSKINI
jgi:hypothetical protein